VTELQDPPTSASKGATGPLIDQDIPRHRHTGLALVIISLTQLMVVLDSTGDL